MRGFNYNGVAIGYTPTGAKRPKLSPGPDSNPPVWNPETDIPEGNRPRRVRRYPFGVAFLRPSPMSDYGDPPIEVAQEKPLSRSETHQLVGVYELLPNRGPRGLNAYRRRSLRSVRKGDVTNEYLDALLLTVSVDQEVPYESLFCIHNADRFEAESPDQIERVK